MWKIYDGVSLFTWALLLTKLLQPKLQVNNDFHVSKCFFICKRGNEYKWQINLFWTFDHWFNVSFKLTNHFGDGTKQFPFLNIPMMHLVYFSYAHKKLFFSLWVSVTLRGDRFFWCKKTKVCNFKIIGLYGKIFETVKSQKIGPCILNWLLWIFVDTFCQISSQLSILCTCF